MINNSCGGILKTEGGKNEDVAHSEKQLSIMEEI